MRGYASIPVKESRELMTVMGNQTDSRFARLVMPLSPLDGGSEGALGMVRHQHAGAAAVLRRRCRNAGHLWRSLYRVGDFSGRDVP